MRMEVTLFYLKNTVDKAVFLYYNVNNITI